MNKTVYVCEGTCHAQITEEQFNAGLTVCGTEGCSLKGHHFTKMYECSECGQVMKENKPHPHN